MKLINGFLSFVNDAVTSFDSAIIHAPTRKKKWIRIPIVSFLFLLSLFFFTLAVIAFVIGEPFQGFSFMCFATTSLLYVFLACFVFESRDAVDEAHEQFMKTLSALHAKDWE